MHGLLVLWALAGCGKQSEEETPAPRAEVHRGGTFRMVMETPRVTDPARVDDVYEAAIVNQLFDGLLAFDPNLNVVPAIATSWTVSRDGRTYTFRLRDDVVFHDGSPVTADDVVFSLTRVFDLDPSEASLAREHLCHIAGSHRYENGSAPRLSGLQVMGDHELRITLDRPFASFLAVLAMEQSRIVPRKYVEAVGDSLFSVQPMGAGPFRLGRRSDSEIVLARFPEYYDGVAHLDSIHITLLNGRTDDYGTDRFLEGELHSTEVSSERLPHFRRTPGVRVTSRQELSVSLLGFNTQRAPFDDARVRRAVAMAVDHRKLLGETADRIVPLGLLPPGIQGYSREHKLASHNLEAAKELLAEAGYADGQGLDLMVLTTSRSSSENARFYQRLAQQLGELGLRVEIESLAWLDYDARLTSEDLQMFAMTWVADIPDPDSFLYPVFHSGASNNFMNYASPGVDDLLSKARHARSAPARWEKYRAVERRILADSAVVPLYHTMNVVAIWSDVQNFRLTPLGVSSIDMERVWIDPSLRPQQLDRSAR